MHVVCAITPHFSKSTTNYIVSWGYERQCFLIMLKVLQCGETPAIYHDRGYMKTYIKTSSNCAVTIATLPTKIAKLSLN